MKLSLVASAAVAAALAAAPALADSTFTLGTIPINASGETSNTFHGTGAVTDTYTFTTTQALGLTVYRADTGLTDLMTTLYTAAGGTVHTFLMLEDGQNNSDQILDLAAGSYKLVLTGTPTAHFFGAPASGTYDLSIATAAAVAPVPELPGWTIGLAGLGMIGVARRGFWRASARPAKTEA